MLGDSVRRRQRKPRNAKNGDAPRSRRTKRKPSRLWAWVIAALLLPFGVGYAVAALVLFPPTEEQAAAATGVAVPDLEGRTSGEAERDLAELGLTLTGATELPHPDAEPGEIIAQDPLPGQYLRPGGGVRVAVSSGPPRARVPDVVGFPLERARAMLQRLGFEVASVERQSETPTGRVIGIAPEPGTEQRLPATVTLVVSVGQPVMDDPTVPDSVQADPGAIDLLEPDTATAAPPADGAEADSRGEADRADGRPSSIVLPAYADTTGTW